MSKKKIVFLTGTRAEFGKQKSLIKAALELKKFKVYIFVTGMHLLRRYGMTANEILKCGYKNIFLYRNQKRYDLMDAILANTIEGFSRYVHQIKPDFIVVHGDRVEALAGAVVGSLNNILVAHIEGGELSGTVDELLRHAISKLSHIHLVANKQARGRLIQMGENRNSIFVIGSPDIDIIESQKLKEIGFVKRYYDIDFDEYAILIFHPVTTEIDDIPRQAKNLVEAVLESGLNYVVIYPNNDSGSSLIIQAYQKFRNKKKIRLFSSLRFEYFLVLLQHATFIIGNSSSAIREAPYYGVPTVNIGSRQNGRALSKEIIHCGYAKEDILEAIQQARVKKIRKDRHFGRGNSSMLFMKLLNSGLFWRIGKQKLFQDLQYEG